MLNLTIIITMSKPAQPIPNAFAFEEGGRFGSSISLGLCEGTFSKIETLRGEESEPELSIPSLEKWITFRRFLDYLNAWKWKPKYRNYDICDGTRWSLKIEYDDARICCSGNNSYPAILDADYEDDGRVSLDWQLFHTYLDWLTKETR